MVTVINQNRFQRVFGTAPDGPFAQVGRHCCGWYRVEQRAAVSSGGVSHRRTKRQSQNVSGRCGRHFRSRVNPIARKNRERKAREDLRSEAP